MEPNERKINDKQNINCKGTVYRAQKTETKKQNEQTVERVTHTHTHTHTDIL